jgi:alpha-glucoside transport system substrate-binding protein
LRWTLTKVRKAIGSDYVLTEGQAVSFNFQSDFWLDVSAFEAGEIELYQGDFLEGVYLRDALRFEEWLFFERERLRGQYQAGWEGQLATYQQQGDAVAMVTTAHLLLKQDNLREDWHRALMAAYARLGKREAALAQFEQCRQLLREELDVELASETVDLAEAIRRGQIEPDLSPTESTFSQSGAAQPEVSPKSRHRWGLSQPVLAMIGAISLIVVLFLVLSDAFDGSSRATGNQEDQPAAAGNTSQQEATVQELAGTTVTIFGPWETADQKLFEEAMQPFEDRTGINIVYASVEDNFEGYIAARVADGNPPDIAQFPAPGLLADLTRQGKVIDLRSFLDDDYLRQQYSNALLEMVTVDGKVSGAWYNVHLKSLVWYPVQAFEAKGYEVPDTWDEMIALSDQIVADGGTPWCISIENGDATGWVGTDWVEDILLRTASPETYDAWVAHDLPFDSPEVRQAFEIMAQIWFNEDYVYGGRANILTESVVDNSLHILEDPPACYLHRQGSWVSSYFFPKTAIYGQDYDFFYLPPIDPEFGKPVLGGGDIFAMFNDRPEVREVMCYLTTAESLRVLIQHGGTISPHRDTPLEWYPSGVELRFAEIILSADTYRFDGSDLMPGKVGTGSFWRGITAWVEGTDLDTVLQDIDNSWSE